MESLIIFLNISILLNIFLSIKMIFVTLENEKVKDMLDILIKNYKVLEQLDIDLIFNELIIKKNKFENKKKRNK